jgi:hypothetical protein
MDKKVTPGDDVPAPPPASAKLKEEAPPAGTDSRMPGRGQHLRDVVSTRLPFWAVGLALFVLGVLLRLRNLDASPYGDEAYYYFITHNLAAYWDTTAYPISGSVFPVYPIGYHLLGESLTTLRVANALVGATAIPLSMGVLRSLGVSRVLQIAAGGLVALNLILVQFSGLAFLDMLGAVVALGAVWAYTTGWYPLAACLTGFAVLEKEYYAFLGIAFFVDYVLNHRRLYRAMVVAGAAVIAWLVLRYGVLHAPYSYLLEGHAHAPLTLGGLAKSVASPALIPLIVAGLVLGDRLRPVGYFIVAFLAFQFAWGNAQGWYWCLTAIGAILLATYGAQLLLRELSSRHLSMVASVSVISILFLAGYSVEAVQTRQYLADWHDHSLLTVAAYVAGQPSSSNIDLVRCFWGYQYFPLGGNGRIVRVVGNWLEVSAPLAIQCPDAAPPPAGWATMLHAGSYTVVSRPSS